MEVRETLPDSFLQLADQVVNLDLAVEDLQERLRAGKIYRPDKVPQALERFFKNDNLVTLRELALREVAESVERASAAHPVVAEPAERSGSLGPRRRVMVCLSAGSPRALSLGGRPRRARSLRIRMPPRRRRQALS